MVTVSPGSPDTILGPFSAFVAAGERKKSQRRGSTEYRHWVGNCYKLHMARIRGQVRINMEMSELSPWVRSSLKYVMELYPKPYVGDGHMRIILDTI